MSENPPAFPLHVGIDGEQWPDRHGMTLRDWFAGQALASIGTVEGYPDHNALAADCYRVADAMLKERQNAA